MTDYVRYLNQGAVRNLPLDPRLIEAFRFLPGMGLQMEVFSGGQPGKGSGLARVGSVRHDHGNAADVFFSRNGQRLNWANAADQAVFGDIVRQARAAGVTGFGAGPGYMQPGSMHVGFGTPMVWGAGGASKNAPAWLRAAYYGAAQTPAPVTTNRAPSRQPSTAGAPARAPQLGVPQTPTAFGDFVAPQPAQAAAPVPDFGSVVANYLQQRDNQQAEAELEQARRQALFAAVPSPFG